MADNGLWAKLWYDALSDQHLDDLDIADFGRWAKLVTYTKKHGVNGKITIKTPARLFCSMLQISNLHAIQILIEKLPNVSVTCNDSGSFHIKFDPQKWQRYQGDYSTDRVRKHREKKKAECNADVTPVKRLTEVDVEVDVEEEVDVKVEKNKKDTHSLARAEIIEDLNQILGTKYKPNTDAIKKLINGRLNEGHTLEDFKHVHRVKHAEWHGTDMQKFLRPQTLYTGKFSSYLNQITAPVKSEADKKTEERAQAIENWANKED
jgi:uncharacterized phage protein (TIGR02220 family)